MSYEQSTARCDWCRSALYDRDNVACRSCYEIPENEVARLQQELERLEERTDQ